VEHASSFALGARIIGLGDRLEDVSLCALVKAVPSVVRRSLVTLFHHVVALRLHIVHRLLGTLDALRTIACAVDWGDGFSYGGFRNGLAWGVGNFAIERCLIHLVKTAGAMVNPPPGTNAFIVGARGHGGRNIKDHVTVPRTLVLDGKDNIVFGADIVDVVGVSNGERTACDIVMASSVEVSRVLISPVVEIVFDRLVL